MELVPCDHFWLEVAVRAGKIIAVCEHYRCRKRGEFTPEEWGQLAVQGKAKNRPIRL